jgi:MFS family permease
MVTPVVVSHRIRVTAGLILGLFLAALEATVVATAMPRVIRELGGVQLYSLPFALYLLMATVSGPIWGRASDLYGRRRLYLAAVLIFLLGSALSGAARSMGMLIATRTLQGLGGGGLQTLTFTLVGELYPLRERARVQGWISGVWGLSALVGPLIGGLIVDHFSWRWVFYLNLPFGIAALLLVGRGVPERAGHEAPRIDLSGAALFTLWAGALIYGLELESPGALIVAALALILFVFVERGQELPLLPFPALRRPFAFRGFLGNLLGGMAFFGMTAYIPFFAQVARGQSATIGGLLLSPMTVGWTVSSVLAARWLPRWGPRPMARWGPLAMMGGFGLWALAWRAPLPVVAGPGPGRPDRRGGDGDGDAGPPGVRAGGGAPGGPRRGHRHAALRPQHRRVYGSRGDGRRIGSSAGCRRGGFAQRLLAGSCPRAGPGHRDPADRAGGSGSARFRDPRDIGAR